MATSSPLIRFDNVTKRFPGVVALEDVSVEVRAGSIHALMGENGAGKSTLGKILAGIHKPTEGRVMLEGHTVHFRNPSDALKAGVGMVHQELAFCENMTVAENLCLGQLPRRGPFLARRELQRIATDRLAAIQARVDPWRRVGELPVSQQQLVQIAGAVARGARILVFDEPTSSLSQAESEHLFDLIKRLQGQGVTSIYVSHRLEEIFRLCDTVTVLRDGRHVGTQPTDGLTRDALIQMMIGRPLEAYFQVHIQGTAGEELLRVDDFSSPGRFDGIKFTVRAGEVVGLAGLIGAGRSEIAHAVFGLDPRVTGRVSIKGKQVIIRSPSDAMRCGLGLVPEDRKRHGLVLGMNCRENASLSILDRFARFGWVNRREERSMVRGFFDRLRVRAPHEDVVVASLSGGNQQKIVLAKWLAAQCRVLIVDEPTRGVDVGAKAEIHGLIDQLANEGSGVLLISSELPELLHLSTRILVMRNGTVVGELPRAEATQETLMRLMAGVGQEGCPP
jgi:ABC-type sugar transport system ATPase subunit